MSSSNLILPTTFATPKLSPVQIIAQRLSRGEITQSEALHLAASINTLSCSAPRMEQRMEQRKPSGLQERPYGKAPVYPKVYGTSVCNVLFALGRRGYTEADGCRLLAKNGVRINPNTLKQGIQKGKSGLRSCPETVAASLPWAEIRRICRS